MHRTLMVMGCANVKTITQTSRTVCVSVPKMLNTSRAFVFARIKPAHRTLMVMRSAHASTLKLNLIRTVIVSVQLTQITITLGHANAISVGQLRGARVAPTYQGSDHV